MQISSHSHKGFIFLFPPASSNFEMAVSYGSTFPVIILLLSIAFTGYLEVTVLL